MQVAVIHTAFESSPRTVAFVEVGDRELNAALEYAFQRTQNIEGSWSKPAEFTFNGEVFQNPDFSEDVTVMAPLEKNDRGEEMGHRSTSVGDHILYGNVKYVVSFAGFKRLVEDDEMAEIGQQIIKQANDKVMTKKEIVANIIAEQGIDSKTLIETIMNTLSVTKSNARVYVYNFKKAQ